MLEQYPIICGAASEEMQKHFCAEPMSQKTYFSLPCFLHICVKAMKGRSLEETGNKVL